jgi:hypothetical protein
MAGIESSSPRGVEAGGTTHWVVSDAARTGRPESAVSGTRTGGTVLR